MGRGFPRSGRGTGVGEPRSEGGGKGDFQGVEGGQGWGNPGVKRVGRGFPRSGRGTGVGEPRSKEGGKGIPKEWREDRGGRTQE